MLKRIHVNQHIIKANAKEGENNPPLTVKTYLNNYKADEVEICGPCKLVYRPLQPLECGAKVWIETDRPVIYFSQEYPTGRELS